MDHKDVYKIGYVARTHGLKGEVTVILTEVVNPRKTGSLYLEIQGQLVPHFIENISDRGDQAFIKFEEVNTPEESAAIKGCSIFLPRAQRATPERGEFYDDEVKGFVVEDNNLGIIGDVREVLSIGPTRMVAVKGRNGKEILIPVNGPFIKSLNRSKKRIKVDLPEGFVEIN